MPASIQGDVSPYGLSSFPPASDGRTENFKRVAKGCTFLYKSAITIKKLCESNPKDFKRWKREVLAIVALAGSDFLQEILYTGSDLPVAEKKKLRYFPTTIMLEFVSRTRAFASGACCYSSAALSRRRATRG